MCHAHQVLPGHLAPSAWRRLDWRLPAALVATCTILYLPYVAGAGEKVFGFLATHFDREGYSPGWGFHPVWLLRDYHLADPPAWAYLTLALILLSGIAAWSLFARRRDEIKPEHMALMGAAFVFLTSPHYPWYFGFLVALRFARRTRP